MSAETPGELEQPEKFSSEDWQKALTEGEAASRGIRSIFRRMPSSPRCGMCFAPFRGLGGKMLGITGFRPSRKNPRFCVMCFEKAPLGGAEVDTGILFADVRGFTAASEHRAPEDVARQLNRFYAAATDVLSRRGAVIDKLVGDEVMALFVPGFAGERYIELMVESAEELLAAVGYGEDGEPWLPLGVGLDHGNAFVGNVGSGEVKDFTAIGDVVNTTARLQAEAKPGQIVMSERVYQKLAGRYPDARSVQLELRGKTEPVAARIVDLGITETAVAAG